VLAEPEVQPAATSAAVAATATPQIRRVQRVRYATNSENTRCGCPAGHRLLRCGAGPRV